MSAFNDEIEQAARMYLAKRRDQVTDMHFAVVGGDALTKHLDRLKPKL